MFYSFEPDLVVDFSCDNIIISGLLNKLKGKKKNVKHGDFFAVAHRAKKVYDFVCKFEKENKFETNEINCERLIFKYFIHYYYKLPLC